MSSFDYVELLGTCYGDPALSTLLSAVDVVDRPKVPGDDRDVSVVCAHHGLELTFAPENFVDVKFREYPDGALVLTNVLFHGEATADRSRFEFALPAGLSFSMNREQATALLGRPNWTNASGTLARWDAPAHCVSARFGTDGRIEMAGVQLPNRYTLRNVSFRP